MSFFTFSKKTNLTLPSIPPSLLPFPILIPAVFEIIKKKESISRFDFFSLFFILFFSAFELPDKESYKKGEIKELKKFLIIPCHFLTRQVNDIL